VPDGDQEVRRRRLWPRVLAGIGVALLVLLLALGVLAAVPVSTAGLDRSEPRPVAGYDAAVRAVRTIRAREGDVLPECRSTLLTHGERASRVVVYVHGLTNCPAQFVELGKQFYEAGNNVLVVRLPYHGLAGKSSSALGPLDAEDLRRYADEVADIAQGLGDDVAVLGLSAGGVVAAWIAQNRADVDRAVVVAPAFGLAEIPAFLSTALENVFSRLPNITLPGESGTVHEYSGTPTHAIAETFRFGEAVRDEAARSAPSVRSLAVVTNANDDTISSGLADELVERWRSHGARVITFRFPQADDLPHDVVDPAHIGARTEISYPVLTALVYGRAPAR
jgi:alpha-beta hydrolase superfamily lysophospholipase